jgi:hypothetical protein
MGTDEPGRAGDEGFQDFASIPRFLHRALEMMVSRLAESHKREAKV